MNERKKVTNYPLTKWNVIRDCETTKNRKRNSVKIFWNIKLETNHLPHQNPLANWKIMSKKCPMWKMSQGFWKIKSNSTNQTPYAPLNQPASHYSPNIYCSYWRSLQRKWKTGQNKTKNLHITSVVVAAAPGGGGRQRFFILIRNSVSCVCLCRKSIADVKALFKIL